MIQTEEFERLSKRMIKACKRLHMKGILSGVGGNISIRTSSPNIVLTSPSGIPIMDMLLDDIVAIDISDIKNDNYKVLKGKYKPTSEILLHGGIYDMRPEIKAVIHTHPPITTAFTCTTCEINYKIQEDQRWYIGDIDSIPFIYSSSKALSEAALPKLKKNYALLLKNHGIVVLGDSLSEAVTITELIEDLSKIYFHAKLIDKGHIIELPDGYWTEVNIETRKNLIYHDEIFD